jgi:hypothetical protein
MPDFADNVFLEVQTASFCAFRSAQTPVFTMRYPMTSQIGRQQSKLSAKNSKSFSGA